MTLARTKPVRRRKREFAVWTMSRAGRDDEEFVTATSHERALQQWLATAWLLEGRARTVVVVDPDGGKRVAYRVRSVTKVEVSPEPVVPAWFERAKAKWDRWDAKMNALEAEEEA